MADTDDREPTKTELLPQDERVEASESASDDDGASPALSVEEELAAAREEARELKDRWLRERADLENVKKRAQRERTEAARYGSERLVRDLLSVVDDLERALKAASEASPEHQLVEGIELVLKSFAGVLERHGVVRVPTEGERFDPSRHEAVAQVESDTHEAGTIVEEHRGGYLLHDRLVRAAMVTVSKGASGGPDLANPENRD